MTEAEVTRECRKYLKKNSIYHDRMNAGHGGHIKSRKGLPDFVACHKGKFYGLEFKGTSGKLRPEQEDIGEEIKASGGRYLVVRSVDDLKKGMKI